MINFTQTHNSAHLSLIGPTDPLSYCSTTIISLWLKHLAQLRLQQFISIKTSVNAVLFVLQDFTLQPIGYPCSRIIWYVPVSTIKGQIVKDLQY